ncbi:MAG: glycine cleavage system protein GcvH [Deltaproteobacteria bacterium]|nr:glycine cleavage system protein GcvH [Deltaproteobacteria bacterium]MBW2296155.1 glycine cleavage system protein GcvH [Deltaproteobacteria bacterium]MBW2611258.1 glycine cleavage system protein GcvH [Deltaproteobacteria bacterium]
MKEISELNFPDDLKYAGNHEWSKLDNDEVTIGICDYAQDQLGDVVFVELPQVGDTFDKGQEFGTVESVKAVSELFIPLSGEVTGVNENLEDTPELVNNEPYTGGWMIKIKPADVSEMDGLMMKDAYLDMLKG